MTSLSETMSPEEVLMARYKDDPSDKKPFFTVDKYDVECNLSPRSYTFMVEVHLTPVNEKDGNRIYALEYLDAQSMLNSARQVLSSVNEKDTLTPLISVRYHQETNKPFVWAQTVPTSEIVFVSFAAVPKKRNKKTT